MSEGQPKDPLCYFLESQDGEDKPWTVQVDVYLEDDTTDPPKFHLDSCLPLLDPHADDKIIVFKNNHRPGFEIIFTLHDLTGKGYRFPRNEDDAVWSKIGDVCPDEQWAKNEVFTPKRVVQPDCMQLVVFNENDKKKDGNPIGRFRYTLNVTKTGSKPYLPLDPGGDDQNGSRTFSLTK